MTSKIKEQDIYQQTLAASVHFSVKTINSNIEKGGVRLSKDQALDLPYISTRTLLADQLLVPTDYQANVGKTATVFKAIKAAQLNEDLSEADDEFKQQVNQLKSELESTFTQPFSAGLDHIDIRMRQLLIPKGDANYISISPISAAGVNLLLNDEVDRLKEQRKSEGQQSALRNIQTAVFGLGGANPQNVGSLVRSMQRPMVMSSPTINPQERLAFQYFYKGFEYQISNAYISRELYIELTRYAQQLIEQKQLSHDIGFNNLGIYAPFSNMDTRAEEVEKLKLVVAHVLAQGQAVLDSLKTIEKQLPTLEDLERKSFWSHPNVSMLIQGLINPEIQQFEDWQILFADHLAKKICQHRYWNQHKLETEISLSEADAKIFLSRRIQELLK
ncbi:hypothetical protein ABEF83_15545 (plasmid) [Acinetobacter thermotolerans]|uniref:hypothetical protein n=1 Tax=Acinetobacter thermotolerans TaxID=3151487 RepID=UPI00325C1722